VKKHRQNNERQFADRARISQSNPRVGRDQVELNRSLPSSRRPYSQQSRCDDDGKDKRRDEREVAIGDKSRLMRERG